MELLEVEVEVEAVPRAGAEEVRLQLVPARRGLTYFRASSSHSHSLLRSPGILRSSLNQDMIFLDH